MKLLLVRDKEQATPDNCTLGTLCIDNDASGIKWHTMERPWIPSPDGPAGVPEVSCINAGTYVLTPRATLKKGNHWLLSNPDLGVYPDPGSIPRGKYGRSLVLIHAANWAHELLGCIAPGRKRTRDVQGVWMVTSSQNAMEDLRTRLANQSDLSLTISWG